MKKTILLSLVTLILLTAIKTKISAQVSIDKNWNTTPYFIDNFTPPRSNWDSRWFDYPNDTKWMAHLITGVTHSNDEHQVYQRLNSIFNASDSTMRLRADYTSGPMQCYNYEIPSGYSCDTSVHQLYYYSGAITILDTLKYGYFETRCKLPTKRGAFPAFWLYDYSDGEYREIDIFEYSWSLFGKYNCYDSSRIFNGGLYYHHAVDLGVHYGDHGYIIPANEPGLENWHKFAAEWTPKRVVWYFDNKPIGEYCGDSMPNRRMYVMLNYALDNYIMHNDPPTPIQSGFPDDMTIDYVRINKLKCNCNNDTVIQNNTQLAAFHYSVKKTITIGGYGYSINLSSTDKDVFRATDGITINGDFEVPLGAELELIIHPCPN
ncbi:MAG: glycoside hydrolase family 16 protein [Bacteroidota bacterium]